jgi:hypothetical protein
MDIVKSAYNFVHAGFNDVRTDVLAIVIALIIVVAFMKSWGQLIFMTIGAVIVHEIILALLPLLNHGKIMVPDVMSGAFWMLAASLAVGYLILIIVLFFLKNNVFKMGKGGGGH